MSIGSVGKILGEIVKWAPGIVSAANIIYRNIKEIVGNKSNATSKDNPITLNELDLKVDQFEQNSLEQAKLLSEMSIQLKNISDLAKVYSSRIRYLWILTILSISINTFLLIYIFSK